MGVLTGHVSARRLTNGHSTRTGWPDEEVERLIRGIPCGGKLNARGPPLYVSEVRKPGADSFRLLIPRDLVVHRFAYLALSAFEAGQQQPRRCALCPTGVYGL
jgi:hypothetical protein